jgi:alanyl-tRNA synthetase
MSIRSDFITFFTSRNFTHLQHSPLVCHNETTLFTVAGMKQFNAWFKNPVLATHKNVVTVQPCLRIAGKHDDLNNVGKTKRHNTLFEMLGIFSFGSLSKIQAVEYMWQFLTQYISPEYLYVTVYKNDQEIYEFWSKKIGAHRIAKGDINSNFWSAGGVGICGPCTEIFFDTHKTPLNTSFEYAHKADDEINPRFLEITNVVFISLERHHEDDTEEKMTKLSCICIDHGTGLERLESVINGTYDNYSVSALQPIVSVIPHTDIVAKRVIADHIRAILFLVSEEVRSTATAHGHILRRLLRQIISYYVDPITLAITLPDFSTVVQTAITCLDYYNQINNTLQSTLQVIHQEAQILQAILYKCKPYLVQLTNCNIPEQNEKQIVYLQNTYGLPIAVAKDYCKLHSLHIDDIVVQRMLRANSNQQAFQLASQSNTEKCCYDNTLNITACAIELYDSNHNRVNDLQSNGFIVLNRSPFYPCSGGQLGDVGTIYNATCKFEVTDTKIQKPSAGINTIIHFVKHINGQLLENDMVYAHINTTVRIGRERAHTATHILCDYLLKTYGVHQAGSKVDTNSFTFDIETTQKFNAKHQEIEEYVNSVITKAIPVQVTHHNKQDVEHLIQLNAVYDPIVRVISINDQPNGNTVYSQQLCGGTHVRNTSDIIQFKILSETALKAGVRRFTCQVGTIATMNDVQQKTNNIHITQKNNTAIAQCDFDIVSVFKKLTSKHQYLIVYMITDKGTQMRMCLPDHIAEQMFEQFNCQGVVNTKTHIHSIGTNKVLTLTDLEKYCI